MNRQNIVSILLSATLFLVTVLVAMNVYLLNKVNTVDERTMLLCREFDPEDFKWEVSQERWDSHEEMIQKYNWYKSCIDYIQYPVSK